MCLKSIYKKLAKTNGSMTKNKMYNIENFNIQYVVEYLLIVKR